LETQPANAAPPSGVRLTTLALTALGVVYGDIGTSPLYALRECFVSVHAVEPTPANVMGVLSLIFWSLLIVISVKYLAFIMRADNGGEGGILALLALARPNGSPERRGMVPLVALGLFGAALLYGDGMITPAISVLSAVEGLEVATPVFSPYVVPITIVILVLLFLVQHQGTQSVGAVFGPVSLVWFAVLAVLGVRGIVAHPEVLAALDPLYGVAFFVHNGLHGLLVLGTVFLVVTGGEALYADMGHFGKRPIRLAWFVVVLPALLLNYFGQGALLIGDPAAAHNPFYRLAPGWALYPLVALATVATIIASQAVISGCYSLTRQAIQLQFFPRLEVRHTSSDEIGQIYVPPVNWALMIATVGLVLGFRSSGALAAAYGVAVATTMVITTIIFYVVARELWAWPWWAAGGLAAVFLPVDLAFFGANIVKIEHGGWFPLVIAGAMFTVMATWRQGRELLSQRLQSSSLPLGHLLVDVEHHPPIRVPGTAVFLTASPTGTPSALLHNLKHNKVLHERVILLTVRGEHVPRVPKAKRTEFEALGQGFYRVLVRYGFMESPSIPYVLSTLRLDGKEFSPSQTTFFLGRETLLATKKAGMALWRERLFAFMARNAQSATAFFHIPPNRVVELGLQIEL
jgi:KUP system potassium uptake protein